MIILSRAIKSEYPTICALSDESSDSLQSHEILSNYIGKSSAISLKKDDIIVGFLIEKVLGDEAELIQITVGQLFQKQGYAFDALERWHNQLSVSGVKTVFLEVREDNWIARALYEKLRYESVGRRKNYYKVNGKTYDAILMKVSL